MRTNLVFALFVVAAAACGTTNEVAEPTMNNVFENVLAPRCTFSACHAAPTRAAHLDLTKGRACQELVNKPSCLFPNRMRIIPGHPEQSFFFHKLTGENLAEVPSSDCSGETNALMPYGGTTLPDDEMALVKSWIAAGAPCEAGPDDTVKPPEPTMAAISQLTASKTAPLAGENIAFTVELDKPAPAEGQTIQIETMTSALFAPVSVFVPAGSTTARFDVNAARPTSRFVLRVKTGDSVKELVLRVAGIEVAEVLSDPIGDDDRFQWIKLRNRASVPISLAGYRLRVGQASYDYSSVPLVGAIPAGGCMVIGGPSSGYQNGDPVFGQVVDFSPDLPSSGAQARGYAVFDDGARPIDEVITPVDTMLVGVNNDAKLLGPDAEVAAPFCNSGPAGTTAKRTGAGTCAVAEMRPNQCP
ncbi:MAG TPA: hypothetical protein VN253_22045 [Kofleriaceae bacterium]|nr:hypothetical protein [Kofleriaceae bacterium]